MTRRYFNWTRTQEIWKTPAALISFNSYQTKVDPPSVKTMMAWRCSSKAFSPTRCFIRAIRSKMVLKAKFRSVPVCSAVGENTREHPATTKSFFFQNAWLTIYFELGQPSLDVDRLVFEKVENVDHFGELGREEEQLVVWTHAEGWNLCRCQAEETQVTFEASTCSAAGTCVIDTAPIELLCASNRRWALFCWVIDSVIGRISIRAQNLTPRSINQDYDV